MQCAVTSHGNTGDGAMAAARRRSIVPFDERKKLLQQKILVAVLAIFGIDVEARRRRPAWRSGSPSARPSRACLRSDSMRRNAQRTARCRRDRAGSTGWRNAASCRRQTRVEGRHSTAPRGRESYSGACCTRRGRWRQRTKNEAKEIKEAKGRSFGAVFDEPSGYS